MDMSTGGSGIYIQNYKFNITNRKITNFLKNFKNTDIDLLQTQRTVQYNTDSVLYIQRWHMLLIIIIIKFC